VVVEHEEFRQGVSCAGTLVRSSRDPVWAVVLSARGDDIPLGARDELVTAARTLAAPS
jgi:hypothetical protein